MTIDIDALQAADNEDYDRRNRALRVVTESVDAADHKSSDKNINEKLFELEEFVDTLFLTNQTIKPQNRKIQLRDYCKKNGLNLREEDINNCLWEGRRRSKGEIEYFTQDTVIHAPKEKWCWENILQLQRTNIISAKPKVGKTTLLIEAFAKWSRGNDEHLGEKFVGKCPPILIFGTDMPKSDWMELLAKFGLAESIGKDEWKLLDPIKVLFTQNNPIHLDEDGFSKMANILNKWPNSISLFDSYAKLCPSGIDERTNHFAEPLAQLQEVIAPYKTTPVIIHHSGKAKTNSAVEASRGHTSLTAGVTQCLAMHWLNRDENPNDERVVFHTEGRARPIRKIILQGSTGFELEGNYEEVMQEQREEEKINNLKDRQALVYEIVKDKTNKNLPTTYLDVITELKKDNDLISDRTSRRTLEQLTKHNLLTVKKMVGKTGNMNWYFVKKRGQDI